jgi:hypothetical protein
MVDIDFWYAHTFSLVARAVEIALYKKMSTMVTPIRWLEVGSM